MNPTSKENDNEESSGSGFRYISDLGRKQLPQYKYTGSDNSLMYTYFCSPLADALVRLMPTWLAPNTITFLGLAFSIAGYILVHIYAPTFKEPCPSWLWLVLAACTFAYQTLDNIDGKQARRTNSSSALGLFIDHGADALNIILTSQNAMALLQLGQRETCWATLAIWTATSTPFFFATWEEHFTGSLYLGLFNGPTDGVLIVCASYVVTALSSPGFWSGQCVLGMSRAECMIFFYLVCVFFTVSANIYSVQQKLSSSRHLGAGLSLTIPFLLHLLFGYWMLGPLHPTETNTRLSLWFLGFCFLILVSALQLANVCGERYKPWRWTLTVLACLLADYILKRGSLWIATTLLLLIWLHFVIQVANEMADILRISIFTLTRNNEK